jgi:peptide/nickel transport system ATP-binding protein
VAEIADDVVVMYLGTVAERGDVDSIFYDPKHPYTRALLESIPKLGLKEQDRLASIRGMVPHPFNRPGGCPFHTRCDAFMEGVCDQVVPPIERIGTEREVRCLLYSDLDKLRKPPEVVSA